MDITPQVETLEHDGAKFYVNIWNPSAPVATVLYIHGFAEHVNRYLHVFGRLAQSNIRVVAFDQRGFGRTAQSSHEYGLTGNMKQVLSDIDWFITEELKKDLKIPIFIYGHSMGGQRAIVYASTGASHEHLAGAIISGPAIEQTIPVPWIKLQGGKFLSRYFPHLKTSTGLNVNDLSRDPEVNSGVDKDELCVDKGSLETFNDILQFGKEIAETDRFDIKCPVLLMHGDHDKLTSYRATEAYFNKIQNKDKTLKIFPGYYHELLMEPGNDKIIVIDVVKDWILARL